MVFWEYLILGGGGYFYGERITEVGGLNIRLWFHRFFGCKVYGFGFRAPV